MTRYTYAAAAVAFALILPSNAHADVATGIVGKLSVSGTATGNQGKFLVTLKSTPKGAAKTMCFKGATPVKEAYVTATSPSANLIQSLLAAALISQGDVTITSSWNGTYCSITTVSIGG